MSGEITDISIRGKELSDWASDYFDSVEFPEFDWSAVNSSDPLEGHYIAGPGSTIGVSIANNLRTITASGSGGDLFFGREGRSIVDGGGGTDTYVFLGHRDDYVISGSYPSITISGAGAFDTLTSVERLNFSNGTLAIDIDGNAGQAYRLYQSAFDRAPDVSGLKFWINKLDNNNGLSWVADRFIDSDEFTIRYGESASNADFVNSLYQNVLDRDGDEGGIAFWNEKLDTGEFSRTDVLIRFSESEENIVGVAPDIQGGIWLW